MNIPRSVVTFLESRGARLATAESCTAGLIASLLAEVPGSGACLDVGLVVYSPTGKSGFLGVRPETIERCGLTSEEVAIEMATGMLRHEACSANIAVANTGIAGPPPDDSCLAANTQCFGWAYERRGQIHTFSEVRVFAGERNAVRRAAALYALSRIPVYFDRAIAPARALQAVRTTSHSECRR